MLIRSLCTAFLAFILSHACAVAQVHIVNDPGGRIGEYMDKYRTVSNSGERVIIDGLCASACTIVLGAVSPDRICVTPRARLGFHAAWDYGENGQAVTNPLATRVLYELYPGNIRRWITARGGLKSKMIFIHGKALAAMGYQTCPVRVPVYASAAPN